MNLFLKNTGNNPLANLFGSINRYAALRPKQSPISEQVRVLKSVVKADNNEINEGLTQNKYFKRVHLYGDKKLQGNVGILNDKHAGIYDYSKEEAQYRRDNPYTKPDTSSIKPASGVITKENLESLTISDKKIGTIVTPPLSIESDFQALSADRRYFNSNEPVERKIDYFASRYAAMSERINNELSGEEREKSLDRLNEMMIGIKDDIAKSFSDSIGGFFEENGVRGETDSIYMSVINEFDKRAGQYKGFIAANNNYADISGEDEAWLRGDSAYMASELRRAVDKAGLRPAAAVSDSDSGLYSLNDMKAMQLFKDELNSYTEFDSGFMKCICTGEDSEETLGMRLGELALKGQVFSEYAEVSDSVKALVTGSIDNYIKKTIAKQQEFMDKWSGLQIASLEELTAKGDYSRVQADSEIENIKRRHAEVDESAILAVIDRVKSAYEALGDAGKALLEGASFAKQTYDSKRRDSSYNTADRYRQNLTYWDNFYEGKDYIGDPESGYKKRESGLSVIERDWNAFMGSVTSNKDALIAINKA